MDQTDAVDGPLLFNTDHSLTSRYGQYGPHHRPQYPRYPQYGGGSGGVS